MSKHTFPRGTSAVDPASRRDTPHRIAATLIGLVLALLPLTACDGNSPVDPAINASRFDAAVRAANVTDLAVTDLTTSTATLTWTQVGDGTGQPAGYQVKYATPPIDWESASVGCDPNLKGDAIGAPMSCTVEGLEAGTEYDFQLMSYGTKGGKWKGAAYSNVATAPTASTTPTDTVAGSPGDTTATQPADTTTTPAGNAEAVTDLTITGTTESTLTVQWTQVDDGAGQPAWYRVKYATSPLTDWGNGATVGCDPTLVGDQTGAPMSCTIEGLDAGTTYDVQLMSYRMVNGVWEGAVYSNLATGETAAATLPADTTTIPADTTTVPADTTTVPADTTTIPADTTTVPADTTTVPADTTTVPADTTTIPADTTTVPAGNAEAVTDLTITGTTESTMSVRWTQVDDGTGQPASYRVKYAIHPLSDWGKGATVGCDPTLVGDQTGAPMSCTIQGLDAGTTYDVQLMSYRMVNGVWEGAVYSNLATGETVAATVPTDTTTTPVDTTTTPPPPPSGGGIWISGSEIAQLPTSGSAWNNLLSEANSSCGTPDLSNQDQNNNVCIMAKALVFARTGETRYRSDVVDALRDIVNMGTYNGRALALGRELAAYVISADLIDLEHADASLDGQFRNKLRELLTTYTNSGPGSLVECHEVRPNNWGTHCGASRAAVAAYLGDTAQLARIAQVFKGWLGDRSSYAGFKYGDLSWQCDPNHPVGINPVGCTRNGHSIDGVLPDDERRSGGFAWPPPKENYVWEALQGALVQAVILERAGYPAFQWEDKALLRAARWLHNEADYAAEGDDQWQPHVLNYYYGANFPAPVPARPGKNVGWTDWTLGR